MFVYVSNYIYIYTGWNLVAYSFEWCPPLTCTVITIKEGWSAWTLIAVEELHLQKPNGFTENTLIGKGKTSTHFIYIYILSNFEVPCFFFLRGGYRDCDIAHYHRGFHRQLHHPDWSCLHPMGRALLSRETCGISQGEHFAEEKRITVCRQRYLSISFLFDNFLPPIAL